MQVLFVGGADSVGASCLAIQLADQWFVVDAGVRVDHRSDPLPDLSLLEGKAVKAIFVTHAHADHIGALPLVHQAFPTVPIYTSRGTALLMEVMLADAVRVMERRAIEEMELPHYPRELVAQMLNLVRPLPIDTPITVPELAGITIQASRAGHIAGAVSLGFESSDGSIVVSGDISITEQRTVLGAVPPPMKQPDLLILESTYGARLHANRQAEEARFAQAVADGIAHGGHVLIPAFGLGRGQEVLLILQDAILKQQIPPFPIYVDGLVRRVCSTYLLLPEALSPRLGRQIRRGFQPFTNKVVSFVGDVRERERILAGSPACIVSSSGMLTGGPSVWYAARLAARPEASILITGYQDEESPGKRLLDVAEHRRDTLELDGQTVPVACHVAKYSLSAHADGGELATYAATLSPRHVALVHGDEEARAALRIRLTNTEVFLPRNGTPLSFQRTKAKRGTTITESTPLSRLPRGIGGGLPLTLARLEQLWKAVAGIPTLRIVTARELALVWYGEATEETTEQLLDVLVEDARQRYFVPQHALEEAFRVRGGIEEMSSDVLNDFLGQVLFIQVAPESAKPAVCRELLPPASLRVWLPKGEMERTRFPTSAILDVLGPLPVEIDEAVIPSYLASLMRQARTVRRPLSARTLASLCHEGSIYSLSELCALLSVSPDDLATRLAVAKLVQQAPRLFVLQQSALASDGQALYTLAPTWEEALAEPEAIEERVLPDQHALLGIIEQYLGNPPDLYRRSVDPESGRITLAFYFPAVAQEYYGEAIEAAAEEAGVEITLTEQPHQGALAQVAFEVLPEGLQATKAPSIYHDYQEVSVDCDGTASTEEIASAEERFLNETGWRLTLNIKNVTPTPEETAPTPPTSSPTQEEQQPDASVGSQSLAPDLAKRLWGMTEALQYAQRLLIPLSGYQRVRVETGSHTLILRFTFPDVARVRYATMAEKIKETTGWNVRFHPAVHQEALVELADHLLPAGLTRLDAPSIFHTSHRVSLMCIGEAEPQAVQAAQQKFLEETGWQLKIVGAGVAKDA